MVSKISKVVVSALCSSAIVACGSVDDPKDPGMDPGMEDDTTPPTIVSTVPAAGATGVASDAKVVVTFSEPMDAASVEATYTSQELPADKVAFEWNGEGNILTITPAEQLEYATGAGNDPSTVMPMTYAVSFVGPAKDLAGNELTGIASIQFATKRRLLANAPLDEALTRVRLGGSYLGSSNDIWIGDNAVNNTYSAYVSFDMSALPAGITVEAAEISARQAAPVGSPYNLGPVMAYHVPFATLNDAMTATALSLPGALSSDAVLETKRLEVTNQVIDDFANRTTRNNRTQYRLQIDQATNDDDVVDRAVFGKSTVNLYLIYVAD